MEKSWNRILVVGLSINLIGQCVCTFSDVSPDETALADDSIFYPHSSENTGEITKRLSQFVRIGKALSSFVRIGKSDPDQEQYFDSADVADDNSIDKRKSAFVRIGRGDFDLEAPDKRLSSFVRIGRMLPDYEKRGGAFIRMGKFPSSAYLRHRARLVHQISPQPYFRRRGRFGKSSFIRIGKRDTTNALAQMENNGKDDEDGYPGFSQLNRVPEPETAASMPSDLHELSGKDAEDGFEEADDEFEYNILDNYDKDVDADKRYSKFVRIGRNGGIWDPRPDMDDLAETDANTLTADKRRGPGSSFVRIGRAQLTDEDQSMLDLIHKRRRGPGSSFVRIGRAQQTDEDQSMLDLIHKRRRGPGSSFVRIGRAQLTDEDQSMLDLIDKRLSQFVRIGKNGYQYPSLLGADDRNKRLSSFVRIGKSGTLDSSNNDDVEDNPDKRMSSFVRIGKRETLGSSNNYDVEDNPDKRMSSFVRIGKDSFNPDMFIEDKRRSLTSIVRIGKKSEPDTSVPVDKTSAAAEAITEDKHAQAEADESKQDASFM